MPDNNYRLVAIIHPLTGLDTQVPDSALAMHWRAGWVPLADDLYPDATYPNGPEPMTREQVSRAMTRRAEVLEAAAAEAATADGKADDGGAGGKPAKTGRASGQSGEQG